MIYLPASGGCICAPRPATCARASTACTRWCGTPSNWTPFGGHLFVLANRRRDRVKILYWDRDGFALWAKRLEEGTYAMPFTESSEARREITAQELGALLSGIDLAQAARRKRYGQSA
jgi:transposase